MKASVSVIIPTCNRSTLVTRAIESVLSQTYTDFECIIVDDASNDNTYEVVNSYSDDRLICFRHDTNLGASAARNTGIKHSKGNFIAFLDDDDEWLSTKLEKQVKLIRSLSDKVGMIHCWMDYFGQNGRIIKEHHSVLRGHVFPCVIDRQRMGGCPTLLVRRKVIERIGWFDESLPRGNDGDFIRRVCRQYEVDYVPEVLVKVYTNHGDERISDKNKKSIMNALKGQKIKLEKFSRELSQLPKQKANIYVYIGNHYAELGVISKALNNYLKAIYLVPYQKHLYKIFFRKLLFSIING